MWHLIQAIFFQGFPFLQFIFCSIFNYFIFTEYYLAYIRQGILADNM